MTNVAVQSSIFPISPSSHDLPDSLVDTSIRRGILLVEPDINLLTAEISLLTRSNYSVTPVLSSGEIFALRDTTAIALAILSDCFDPRALAAIAQTVRKQWPLARILVIGRPEFVLEDHLYDEQIDHSSNPTQLLEGIESLYKDSWNQHTHTLDWDVQRLGIRAVRSPIRESDPTKTQPFGVEVDTNLRGTPSDMKYRAR